MTYTNCVFSAVLVLWICLNSVRTVRVDLSDQQLSTVPRISNRDVGVLILYYNDLLTLDASSLDLYPDLEELSFGSLQYWIHTGGTFDRRVKLHIVSFVYNYIRHLPVSFGLSVHTITEIQKWETHVNDYVFNYPYFGAFEKLLVLDIRRQDSSGFTLTFQPVW